MAKNPLKNAQSEPYNDENHFDSSSNPAINFPPPRTPLNSIPDPLQLQGFDHDSKFDKSETTAPTTRATFRSSDRGRFDSAHCTPARSVSRTANCVGPMGSLTGPTRAASIQSCTGERAGSSSKVSRGLSVANCEAPVEIQHFELEEDPSFWDDHNVQVLIRMRPLNNMEKISHGYGQCLQQESLQTLVWLGPPEIRFTFDHIACETISQEKLFRVAGLPMVDNCMSGYNSCMFAYGQTGSGKTYTMMGDIGKKDGKLNEDCGITPRLFEYLFRRIKEEEESRRDERLKYSCKCSFLEIYNEQITDLLEPSSNNLQLREDLKKGVYVENLMEYNVRTVDEVLKLLLQGAANRKVAGTNMNSESSRSHSVFTCIIESRREKDSTTHLRFGRLNLVDLAGSERQKSFGAGERLKEATYINKSLSTLGLVIMSLVDLAHGKHRHVPYRDSRLTFLLQDSLGGNSKTTIIANVSPSICSANETLSTLKFAQRAKLIQNNAKVNEDASGDVTALQRQIQLLKAQISLLTKNHKISRSLLHLVPSFQYSFGDGPERNDCEGERKLHEGTSICALRREKSAETASRTIVAQNEQRNKLALQSENEDGSTAKQLEECKNMNCILIRRVEELQSELNKYKNCNETAIRAEPLEFNANDCDLLVETMPQRTGEMTSCDHLEDGVYENNNDKEMEKTLGLESTDILNELMDARILLEAMASEQVCLIEELEYVRQENHRLLKSLKNGDNIKRQTMLSTAGHKAENGDSEKQTPILMFKDTTDNSILDLQVKLAKMSTDLEEAHLLKKKHLKDHMLHLSQDYQIDLVREEAEMEAAKTILHLQEEVASLQVEHQQKLSSMAEENRKLRNIIAAKDDEIRALHGEWERASLELTSFLLDGSKSLRDASGQIESIACSFPEYNVAVGEHIKMAAKLCVEKEETIFLLEKSLEDAQRTIIHMQEKLNSLRNATQALVEFQQLESISKTKGAAQFSTVLDDNANAIDFAKNKLICMEDVVTGVEPSSKTDRPPILHQIIDELAKINKRLDMMRAFTNTITDMHDPQLMAEDLEGWTTDFSTPGSSLSDDSIASGNRSHNSPDHFCGSHFKVIEQTSGLEFEGLNISGDHESGNQETTLLQLRKEFKMAYDAFVKLDNQFETLLKGKDLRDISQSEVGCYLESFGKTNTNDQYISEDWVKQCTRSKMSILHPSELKMQEDEVHPLKTRKFVSDDKFSLPHSFFSKFEAAHATIDEANSMLNALTKANEKANILTGTWKQAGEELMVEKAILIEEISQLKSYIHVRDEEYEILQDQSRHSLMELENSMSLLEGSFLHMQRDAEDSCKAIYSDALSIVQDTLHFIFASKSSLEDIFGEAMENQFASLVIQQCHIEEYFKRIRSLSVDPYLGQYRVQLGLMNSEETLLFRQGDSSKNNLTCESGNQGSASARLEKGDFGETHDDLINEAEKLSAALSQAHNELKMKTSHFDDILVQHKKLEGRLADTETALCASNSDLEKTRETMDALSYQNAELKVLLEDFYLKRSETEEQLEEQKEIVKALEKEIRYTASSAKEQLLSSLEDIKQDLRRVASERDQLREQVNYLQDKLEMAYSLADENEAIAVEARQEAETSKLHAEQKEEEVKILEHSIEELEYTINVLEKKVCEMEHEVERHRVIRDSLELELQALNERLSIVEDFKENGDSDNNSSNEQREDRLSRKLHDRCLKLHEAHRRIDALEDERAQQAKEINQCKDYISELVLHAEAQASQYQQKYKNLEAMISAMKTDSSTFVPEPLVSDKTDKSSVRMRGSSSPFRCISSLVQQMNVEKDQELSLAKLRIEELDALASSQKKEVCMLNTRLAAAESMTHDVIRDLLGVKLDITNYANLIDQCQLQKLVEESSSMEREVQNLRRQINDLLEERERFISEVNRKEEEILCAQMSVEQLRERDQLLTAQNEMLKSDKTNLQRRAAELDEMVKKLLGTQSTQPRTQHHMYNSLRPRNPDPTKSLAHSEKLLLRVNDELAQYRRHESSSSHCKSDGRGTESKFR